MIKNLYIENFRAFEKRVDIRFRPITVFIGRNSAGKSSALKFLLMLKQSLSHSGDTPLCSEGDDVHLGAFGDLSNTCSKKNKLYFGFEWEDEFSGPRELLSAFKEIETSDLSPKSTKEYEEVNFRFPKDSKTATPSLTYNVSIDVPYGDRAKHHSQVIQICSGEHKFPPIKTSGTGQFYFLRTPPQAKETTQMVKGFLEHLILESLRSSLRSIRHLSPLRQESQRVIQVVTPPQDQVGSHGEHTLTHLFRILKSRRQKVKTFITKHLENVASVTSVDPNSAFKGYLAYFQAENKETGGKSSLADFGFGVSQCLPIFVQGAIMDQGQLLIVEQPEAHLHPTAQLSMGSFFSDLWRTRKVPSLIETHSSNVLLRLRREVANGKLDPKDLSIAFFYTEKGQVNVKNLDVDTDGNLQRGLPMEFFGADIIEGLKLGAKT